jgi:hypothetical protein
MPAYTLRDYSLHWAVTSPDGSTIFSAGNIPLPILPPGSQWSGEFEFNTSPEEYIVTVDIIRPTGYSVTERSYNATGELIP